MVAPEGSVQGGRSTRRSQGATPIRNTSPPQRTTRAGSATANSTPGTRRSARAASRRIEPPKDAVANPALPEIHLRQSYAYGSSKAPQLPEQLHAQNSMSMSQVAARMESAIQRAEQNLGEHVAEIADARAEQVTKPREAEVVKKPKDTARKFEELQQHENFTRQVPPKPRGTSLVSQATEVQKQQRTAAWASSLDDSQLEDIPEESSDRQDSSETRLTEPSSFPSGVFDHSYNYERGVRAPRMSEPSKVKQWAQNSVANTAAAYSKAHDFSDWVWNGVADYLWRFGNALRKALFELPDSTLMAVLMKSFLVICLGSFMSMVFCFAYRNYLCDPMSTSSISQTLQNFCGTCSTTPYALYNTTKGYSGDPTKLATALHHIKQQIHSIESRLGQQIERKYANMQSEIETLRQQQTDLTGLLESLGHSQNLDTEIPSPLIPKVNFFSPDMGALVDPRYTSPTQQKLPFLPLRVLLSIIGLRRYRVNGPNMALRPWQDVGDCWCASISNPGQDRVRIGIEVREMIFATELVVEHPPLGTTMTPDTAPRNLELWADFSHLSPTQWSDLDISSMQVDTIGRYHPISASRSFAKLADIVYDVSKTANHVQKFKLDVNQLGDLRYPAQKYVVRARTNYGASYSCLYRIRLHGVPVVENIREVAFTKEWFGERGYKVDDGMSP